MNLEFGLGSECTGEVDDFLITSCNFMKFSLQSLIFKVHSTCVLIQLFR